ncbi:ArsR/SmtB family transcription factor [Nanoarchaeota archaeon]
MAKKDKKFLLVSLEDNKAKKLAQVISSDTSRKILDILAETPHSETKIAEKLNLPLSTVHYNLQNLVKAQLVETEEFHYSKKGREILHYSLANRYVIIAPKKPSEGFAEKLKRILPVALLTGGAATLIGMFSKTFGKIFVAESFAPRKMMAEVAPEAAKAVPAAQEVAQEALAAGADAVSEKAVQAAPVVTDAAVQETSRAITYISQFSPVELALFFAAGAIFGVACYVLVDYIIRKYDD